MAVAEVILSDGEPCEVKRLGIFDLDGEGPAQVGPYTYKWSMADGSEVESVYDIHAITRPPQHPGVAESDIQPNTPNYYALMEYQTFRAALAHDKKRVDGIINYVGEISRFIVDRCLTNPSDISRILEPDDWALIYHVAIVPQITIEFVAGVLKKTFSAHYEGNEIFDAMQRVNKGHGAYDALRLWEFEAMERYGFKTEDNWADLSLNERVRKVASIALPKLMETLEADRQIKELKAKNKGDKGSG